MILDINKHWYKTSQYYRKNDHRNENDFPEMKYIYIYISLEWIFICQYQNFVMIVSSSDTFS